MVLLPEADESVHETAQLASYDSAIASTKLLAERRAEKVQQASIAEHQRVAQAEKTALVQEQKVLLTEKARSHSMKVIRVQLAQQQALIAQERKRLQAHSLKLAELQQQAKQLLSPQYVPTEVELQAVAGTDAEEAVPMF